MENLLADAGLLQVLLAGVGVIGIHHHGGIDQLGALCVELGQVSQILVVVVGQAVSLLVDVATKDSVSQGVARGLHLPAAEDEGVRLLGRGQGVHHDRQIASCGVLHAYGAGHAAGYQAVLLIFHRAGTHSHVGKKIVQVAVISGVKHLVGGGETELGQHPGVELTNGQNALVHIRRVVGVGLMEHTLVALAGGAGLTRVDAGDQDQLISYLVLQKTETADVLDHRLLAVGRAGADDQHLLVGLPRKDPGDLGIHGRLDSGGRGGNGIAFLGLLRDGELVDKIHRHSGCSPVLPVGRLGQGRAGIGLGERDGALCTSVLRQIDSLALSKRTKRGTYGYRHTY